MRAWTTPYASRVAQRHLAAAPSVLAGRDHLEPVGQPLVDEGDQQVGEGQRGGPQVGHRHPLEDLEGRLQGGQREHRRRAHGHPGDAGCRLELERHVERTRVPPPAGDRLVEAVLVLRGHPDERGGAGAAVEVLVGAPHREVGADRGEVHRHRAGRVAEVPQHQRAGPVGRCRDAGQVEHRAGAEVDVGQGEHRDVLVEGGRRVAPGRTSAAPSPACGRRRPRRSRRWGRSSAPPR